MNTYKRAPVEFVRGDGALLFDSDGREYLDFLGGISVASVGHCRTEVLDAMKEQAGQLMHVSNLFYTAPMVDLAECLSKSSLGGAVFFCNSGTEANECAIKIARKAARRRGVEDPVIVTVDGDFHGRTYGSLSATPGLSRNPDFAPMVPGFGSVPFDDAEALEAAVGPGTAAIMLEPIQGEAGVFPVSDEFLLKARELCDRYEALLIFDEVQTGVGRTGSLWAYQQGPVRPDLMTVAKALGGGVAIGACIGSRGAGSVLEPGDHGSTFAAGPVAARAGLAVLDLVDRPETLRAVRDLGDQLGRGLAELDGVDEVRGRGLMIGVGLEAGIDAAGIAAVLLRDGLVVNAPRPDTLRLLPPFVLTVEQADLAVGKLASALSGTGRA
ncbi:MAG: acetylornithine/succinylornithine family transaminase [Solirubrobacterales bacterium]|nr:acetylornithine/succinylornithine family transaminase [Solirubrobacterales bacterium]